MAYTISFAPSAARDLRGLDATTQRRVAKIIESLADDPRPNGVTTLNAKEKIYRVRVGDYRVVYQVADRQLTILVLRIGHRRDIYRR